MRMRRLPYLEMWLGRLIYRNWPNEPPYEKGIDVKLATDMLVHAFRGNYDVIILVSGDSDFADALQSIKDQALHVEVALFGGAWASQHQGCSRQSHNAGCRLSLAMLEMK